MQSRWFAYAGAMVILGLCAGQGCPTGAIDGTSGAGDGNGSGETSKLLLPSALTLDIDEYPEDSGGESARETGEVTAEEAGEDAASSAVRMCLVGPTVVHGFHRLLDRGLALAAGINNDMDEIDGSRLQATLRVNEVEVPYKADFAAFDIDGDGQTDGSGQPEVEPVAIRLWVDADGDGIYQRFLCAVITTRASSENVGAGTLYVHPAALADTVNEDFFAQVTWDRTGDDHRWNEAYTTGRLRGGYRLSGAHVRVDLNELADGGLQKTVRCTSTFTENRFDLTELRYVGRVIRGSGHALLNAEADVDASEWVSQQCVSLADCSAAEGECDGIDTSGMDFLTPPGGTETDWPADFPETPTF